jgi:short subunit dehydrogenase-like uncharacterized protein
MKYAAEHVANDVLIYGANGYTGELVARHAVARGLRPVLAGRTRARLQPLATELGLAARAFGLEDPAAVVAGLEGMRAVIHCAGPFSHTARAMVDACLAAKVHYLDITGEAVVFESLASRDREAQAAGVMLLPGAGFDVVPSDCLAAHLKRRLPTATSLVLAFHASGAVLSRGTTTTMVENLEHGGLVRKNGVLTRVPSGWKTRTIDFGRGPRHAVTIPWGDVSTAFHSTGIPDIEVYTSASTFTVASMRLSRLAAPLLGSAPLQAFLKQQIARRPPGPTEEERARGQCFLWGEARDATRTVVSRERTPEGYTLTALTAVAAAEKVLAGHAPAGFQTPAKAYGPDFILEIPGVAREDL